MLSAVRLCHPLPCVVIRRRQGLAIIAGHLLTYSGGQGCDTRGSAKESSSSGRYFSLATEVAQSLFLMQSTCNG